MRSFVLTALVLIFVGIWQNTEGACNGRRRHYCLDDSDCPKYYACLPRGNSTKKRCRVCPCEEQSQCYLDENNKVACNCSGYILKGPHCNCWPCFGLCPDGFIRFKGTCQCYKVFNETKTWVEAEFFCRQLLSTSTTYLVKITSEAENHFIHSHLLKNASEIFWIGGNDLNTEGTWLWVEDSSPVEYDNWASGQPSNETNSDCMAIKGDGNWADENCNNTYSFICEYVYI